MERDRLLNLVAAFSVAVTEALQRAGESATGLGGEGPAALLTIGTRPDRTIEHLRRTLGLSHSGTVRLVDRLEERGWVRRLPGRARREVHLALTEAGAQLVRDLSKLRHRVLTQLLRPATDLPGATLEQALAHILRSLPGERGDAWHLCRWCDHALCRGASCPVGSSVEGAGR